jgi:hypothetical protein
MSGTGLYRSDNKFTKYLFLIYISYSLNHILTIIPIWFKGNYLLKTNDNLYE